MFLETKDETFAAPVRSELLYYATDWKFDFNNRSRFPITAWNDLPPGYMISAWCQRLLMAYAYCKGSTSFSAGDKTTINGWFLKVGNYFNDVLNYYMGTMFPNRMSNDYSVIANTGNQNNIGGYFHQGSEPIYTISTWFNNRRASNMLNVYSIGAKLNNATLMGDAIRLWKEFMAYGTWAVDCTPTEFYRGNVNEPEQGLSYAGAIFDALGMMADIHNRNYDNSLYEWVLDQSQYNNYFQVTNRPWFNCLAATGKTFKKLMDAYLKYYDGSYGTSRRWNNENIDGLTSGQNYATDTLACQFNKYYKDANIKAIYTRTKAGTRQYGTSGNNTGAFDYYGGWLETTPGRLLLFGQTEVIP
jgi:hypothetical protein